MILLLAAYLLMLTVVPCGDRGEAVLAGDAPSLLHEVSPEHEHRGPEHQDHCTLFCVCACCSVVVGTPPAHPDLSADLIILPPAGRTVPFSSPHWTPLLSGTGTWEPPRA